MGRVTKSPAVKPSRLFVAIIFVEKQHHLFGNDRTLVGIVRAVGSQRNIGVGYQNLAPGPNQRRFH
jgi:hypothetical protein